jgi:apolipoprotein N-acyltransferase
VAKRETRISSPESRNHGLGKTILGELGLLLLSALLFALSFPTFIYEWGFPPVGFVAIIPAFIVIHRSGWIRILPYGLFYGFFCYTFYNFWLITWHPMAIFIVPSIYAFYFLIFFPILKLIDTVYPKYGYFFQAVAWIGYEYLRTQGFLGYSYGVLGYTQYPFLPLIRIASLFGVWGVTFLVIFPSVFLGNALKRGLVHFRSFITEHRVAVVVYGVVFLASIIYGVTGVIDISEARKWKVALVQQNIDPWRGGYPTYDKALRVLTRLSREALRENPEIVIWSETSFVPGIDWHTKYRTDDKSYQYVKRLKDFLKDQPVAFVIGNNDGQKRLLPNGKEIRVDYNATVLYRDNRIVDIYRKLHLVQFSEHFPYRGMWTWLYNALSSADIHWYEKGKDHVIFEDGSVRFATPICFEDTFGDLNREFVQKGADVLVNMTNDSWSNSVVCEIQHMTMAIFRAVENSRSMVRSTNGGITCIIDPTGRVLGKLEPFTADYLIGSVPVITGRTTLYTRFGDWMGYSFLFLALIAVVVGIIRYFVTLRGN